MLLIILQEAKKMGYNNNFARIIAGLFSTTYGSGTGTDVGAGGGYTLKVTDGSARTDGQVTSSRSGNYCGLGLGYGRYYMSSNATTTMIPSRGQVLTTAQGASTQTTLVVGSGTTPVTDDDYKLDTPITTLTAVSATTSCKTDDTGATLSPTTFTITTTYRNGTEAPITVNEIGIMIPVGYKYSGSGTMSNALSSCLIYREVLETPVTIEPNQLRTFSIATDVATILKNSL